MYIEIKNQVLRNGLSKIIGVIEQRQTLPILANLLLVRDGNNLVLVGSDAEIEIKCQLQLEQKSLDNDGSITVPARKLFAILKALPSGNDIQINIDDNTALIKSNRSKFKLQTLPAEDFPNTPELDNPTHFNIKQRDLKNYLSKTLSSIAVDDVRYYLTGLLLEISDGKITFVATDGHRMAVAEYGVSTHNFIMHESGVNIEEKEHPNDSKVIIPRKAVLELSKMLQDDDSDVNVSFDDNHICFDLGNSVTLISKVIDGEFPDWKNVLPIPDKEITLDTATFKQSITRASILSNEKYKGIRLALSKGLLEITAKNTFQEEAEEILEIEYDAADLEIGFNGVYLLDALSIISTKNVVIGFTDEESSCLIQEEGNLLDQWVIMPMRV
jgi:DNA polymerase-3 subunit beta